MLMLLYRYISYVDERDQVILERKVLSTNPASNYKTFYTPDRYSDPAEAQKKLSLKSLPTHRVGPVIVDIDLGQLRNAIPQFGNSGLGVELHTYEPAYLPGFWDFTGHSWSI